MAAKKSVRSLAATKANYTRQINAVNLEVQSGGRSVASGAAVKANITRRFRAKGLPV